MFNAKKQRLEAEEEDERCFTNPYLADADCTVSGKTEALRSKHELPVDLRERLKRGILTNLPLIDHTYQADAHDQSIYTGSAGVALLHLRLATSVCADDPPESNRHLHTALSLLSPSLQQLSTRRSTFLCGGAGPLALGAVVHAHLGHAKEAKACVQDLKKVFLEHKSSFASLPSELLFGHSGFLYSLLFVNSYIPNAIEEALIAEVCTLLLDTGEKNRERGVASPLMYTWHDKHYLGAAHGLAGILTLLLQVPVASLRPRITVLVRTCVDYLLSLQLASGNFPSSLESCHSDRLVHWCHGAPGFVHLMAHAYREFKDDRYLSAAIDCGEVVWKRGLLRKGYGLCHGAAGNAYTFLQLYRLTGRPEYVNRTVKFTEWCLTSSQRKTKTPDTPFSLFEGLAGPTYFYGDLLGGLENTRFPALELPLVIKTFTA